MAKARSIKNPFITVNPPPFFYFDTFSALTSSSFLFSPKKISKNHIIKQCNPQNLSLLCFSLLLISFTFFAILVLAMIPSSHNAIITNCSHISPISSLNGVVVSSTSLFSSDNSDAVDGGDDERNLSKIAMVPLPAHEIGRNVSKEEREFWKQPDSRGFRPCLDFSIGYRKSSVKISKEKKRFLMVVASGGLNQQRNQIVDAVVIARILEAALVVPVLQVNLIWEDESEFSDIFDVKHFKRTLKADVRVVSSLPSTHLMSRQTVENKLPHDVPPQWIRARFFRQLNKEGVLVLKGLDSKLSVNLPPDLQKLRCKVAFHALRFAAPIREVGNRLARRMWIEGPYIGLHLRLEKDVWVRTGCRTGLGLQYDHIIAKLRESQPEYLTGRLNMTYTQRRLAGLCPLNALEVARVLKGLGAPRSARIYGAGGEPFGGRKRALQSLVTEFPNLVTKETLAQKGELSPFVNKSSALAAIDYIVSLTSDVFMPSHGGNMGRAMQGHRAYVGHRKSIKPNKRVMLPLFEDTTISDKVFGEIMRKLHNVSMGQPEIRTNSSISRRHHRDVIAYPVPECMCNINNKHSRRLF